MQNSGNLNQALDNTKREIAREAQEVQAKIAEKKKVDDELRAIGEKIRLLELQQKTVGEKDKKLEQEIEHLQRDRMEKQRKLQELSNEFAHEVKEQNHKLG